MFQVKQNREIIKKITIIAAFSALAFVVGLIEIPWGISLIPGLKLDLSDIITVLCFLLIGFKGTTIMLLVKSILRFLILRLGGIPLMGLFEEFMALFASFMYLFSFLITNKIIKKTFHIATKMAIQVVFSTAFVMITMVLFNFIFSTPMYLYFVMGADNFHVTVFTMINDPAYTNSLMFFGMSAPTVGAFLVFCIVAYAPFNAVKGAISALVGVVAYESLKNLPIIKTLWPKKIGAENQTITLDEESHKQDN